MHYTRLFVASLLIGLSAVSSAQDRTLYTGIFNFIPADRDYPVFGLLNVIRGDHTSVQIGLLNHSAGSFRGFQAALVNEGVINVRGFQTAFINRASGEVRGSQAAFINHADKIEGAQIGFVNHARVVDGVQLGIVNYSDSLVSGLPIGLLYLGKSAILSMEVGATEMHPFKLSVRSGVERLYFIISAAYSDNKEGYLLLGAGVGTKLPIGNRTSLNPELQYVGGLNERTNYDYYSVSLNYGFEPSDNFGIFIGPSFGYNIAARGKSIADNPPFANLVKNSGTSRLEFVAGIRAGIRFNLTNIVTR